MERRTVLNLTLLQDNILDVIIKAWPNNLPISKIAREAGVHHTTAIDFIRKSALEECIEPKGISTRRKISLKLPKRSFNSDITHLLWWVWLATRFSLDRLELMILLYTRSKDPQRVASQLGENEKQVEIRVEKSIPKKLKVTNLSQARRKIKQIEKEFQEKLAAT